MTQSQTARDYLLNAGSFLCCNIANLLDKVGSEESKADHTINGVLHVCKGGWKYEHVFANVARNT